MSYSTLKIIAIISMIFDHTGYLIFGSLSWFNYIGRIAFPIFAFGISEGYKKTKNLKKYFFRFLNFSIVSQVPYMLYINKILGTEFNLLDLSSIKLNIGFTLLLGLLAITLFDKYKHKILGLISALLLSIFGEIISIDYGWYGILLIFCFYAFYDNKFIMSIAYTILVVFHHINLSNYIPFIVSSMIPLLLIYLYNNKKGRNFKYFFYIFYPAHLLALYLLNLFL